MSEEPLNAADVRRVPGKITFFIYSISNFKISSSCRPEYQNATFCGINGNYFTIRSYKQ
jgi:hypothetical protein